MNAPTNETHFGADWGFIRNTNGEVVGQSCYQDTGRLFVRRRDHELNGEKLEKPVWRAWQEVK